ncbi:Kae1-associated serine/threonine protein kinase [candidate division WOR-3 bacterium]|nr:Kae1-associated serine/threonine protein kinase [candidate division WOR-3 bacterium]
MDLLRIGAEARIFKTRWHGIDAIKKVRVKKRYRNELLDAKLCEGRIKKEATLLHRAKSIGIITPTVLDVNLKARVLVLEWIPGKKAKESIKGNTNLCKRIGECIAALHNAGLIHGDLTMDNIIVSKGYPVLIDFGLGFYSEKIEDKATDILNLKKSLLALRPDLQKEWLCIEKQYEKKAKLGTQITRHTRMIEKRARYL